jgi:hypothetical protein
MIIRIAVIFILNIKIFVPINFTIFISIRRKIIRRIFMGGIFIRCRISWVIVFIWIIFSGFFLIVCFSYTPMTHIQSLPTCICLYVYLHIYTQIYNIKIHIYLYISTLYTYIYTYLTGRPIGPITQPSSSPPLFGEG